MLAVVNLGIMLPAAPGCVGALQVFAVAALGVSGVGRELALAMAIDAHVVPYALVTAIGVSLLGRQQLSLAGLFRPAREQQTSGGAGLQSTQVASRQRGASRAVTLGPHSTLALASTSYEPSDSGIVPNPDSIPTPGRVLGRRVRHLTHAQS